MDTFARRKHLTNINDIYIQSRFSFDDRETPISFSWVAANFPNKGPQYSARIHKEDEKLEYWNRSGIFVYKGEKLDLKTRGEVRNFCWSLGLTDLLDKSSDEYNPIRDYIEQATNYHYEDHPRP